MSRREVRPSTKEASERQKQKGQEEKEILELKKTSAKLRDVIREEATVYVGEELQLVEYTAPIRESAGNLQASEISFDKTTVRSWREEGTQAVSWTPSIGSLQKFVFRRSVFQTKIRPS